MYFFKVPQLKRLLDNGLEVFVDDLLNSPFPVCVLVEGMGDTYQILGRCFSAGEFQEPEVLVDLPKPKGCADACILHVL